MTTSVTILNHGPDWISVAPIDNAGETIETERQTIQPSAISRPVYVYNNRHVHVMEVKPLAEPKA